LNDVTTKRKIEEEILLQHNLALLASLARSIAKEMDQDIQGV
jgi:hypothetical protein